MAEMATNFEAVAMHDDFLELEEDGPLLYHPRPYLLYSRGLI